MMGGGGGYGKIFYHSQQKLFHVCVCVVITLYVVFKKIICNEQTCHHVPKPMSGLHFAYLDVNTLEQLIISLKSHIAVNELSLSLDISTCRAYADNASPKEQRISIALLILPSGFFNQAIAKTSAETAIFLSQIRTGQTEQLSNGIRENNNYNTHGDKVKIWGNDTTDPRYILRKSPHDTKIN